MFASCYHFLYMFRSPVLRQHTEQTVLMLSAIQLLHYQLNGRYQSGAQSTRQQTIAKLLNNNGNQQVGVKHNMYLM